MHTPQPFLQCVCVSDFTGSISCERFPRMTNDQLTHPLSLQSLHGRRHRVSKLDFCLQTYKCIKSWCCYETHSFFCVFFFFYHFSVKSIKLFSKSWDIVNFWVQHFIVICLCPMFCRLFWVQWSRSVKSRWKTEEWRTHRGENKQTTSPIFSAASSETVCKVLFFYCMKSCDNNIPSWGEFGRRRSSPTVKRGVA